MFEICLCSHCHIFRPRDWNRKCSQLEPMQNLKAWSFWFLNNVKCDSDITVCAEPLKVKRHKQLLILLLWVLSSWLARITCTDSPNLSSIPTTTSSSSSSHSRSLCRLCLCIWLGLFMSANWAGETLSFFTQVNPPTCCFLRFFWVFLN